MKKAIFYTVDALIFTVLIISVIALLPKPSEVVVNHQSLALAKDTLNILSEIRIGDLNNTWLDAQITDGNITNINQTLLEQLGEFWANDELVLAYGLINTTIAKIIPDYVNYGFWLDDEVVFTTTNPPKAHLVSAWKVVSGLEKAKPVKGFIANARATSVTANSTMVLTLSPQGSGWEDGEGFITKQFNTTNMTIYNAELVLSVHADESNSDVQVLFNSGLCDYSRNDFTWSFSTEGNVGTRDVTSCLIVGINNMTIELNNDNYNSHLHPGTQLIINFSSTVPLTQQETDVSERYYFSHIRSDEDDGDGSGAWASQPFVIPEDATNVSTYIQIVGESIRNYNYPSQGCDIHRGNNVYCENFYGWAGWTPASNYDYIMFLNSGTPFDSDASPSSNPTYTYNQSDLEDDLVNGTNLLIVYFNNYGDYAWGSGDTILYSDEFGDPQGSSYVEVNYTIPVSVPFGMIEITQLSDFGGINDDDVTTSFTYPTEAQQQSDSFIHIVQRYSWLVTEWAGITNPPTNQIFTSPAARGVPTTTFIDQNNFALSPLVTNYIRAQDSGSGNDILNISQIEYRFYVPSFVGYGNVFSNDTDAINDALDRLDQVTGPFLSTAGIQTELNTINEVPSLWGPAVVEVRVWN